MKNLSITIVLGLLITIFSGCSTGPNIAVTKNIPEIDNISIDKTVFKLVDNSKEFFEAKFNEFTARKINEFTQEEYLDFLSEGIQLYKDAISFNNIWSAKDIYKHQISITTLKREYELFKMNIALNEIADEFYFTKTAKDKINVCKRTLAILNKEMKKLVYKNSDLVNIKNKIIEVSVIKKEVEEKFEKLLKSANKELKEKRKSYVYKHGKNDLNTANKYFKENNNKWFNWGIFGHARNNMNSMKKAWTLCSKVKYSNYSKYSLKCQAANLQDKLAGIMRKSQIKQCKKHPIKYYKNFKGFPNWNPMEKAEFDYIKENENNNLDELHKPIKPELLSSM